jgi:arsenate reductase (thioredoxin)
MKQKVLFICIHNSARSQMAEAWLNHLCGDIYEAESAGLEPGTVNPLVIEAMAQEGIDISHKGTRSVFDAYRSGTFYSYIIRVCDQTVGERCPIFPGVKQLIDWSFPDPTQAFGTEKEKLVQVCAIRDAIREQIEAWCEEKCGEVNSGYINSCSI